VVVGEQDAEPTARIRHARVPRRGRQATVRPPLEER
jgi:hypothetical protein